MILCLWHFSLKARLWHTKELKCHFHVTDYKPEVQRWPLLGTRPQVEKLDDSQRGFLDCHSALRRTVSLGQREGPAAGLRQFPQETERHPELAAWDEDSLGSRMGAAFLTRH